MKRVLMFIVLLSIALGLSSGTTSALGLKMQPLLYKDTLQVAEKKKGFIDISNPTGTNLLLKTSVQGFRQIDNSGSLEFFDSPALSAGLLPDLSEFELAPHEAIRLYFLLDGNKLPSGDIFAVLFVQTQTDQTSGVAPSVRLGTLFTLTNGTPGGRKAEIISATIPFWQFGDGIRGKYSIKNTSDAQSSTGFFPDVTIGVQPFSHSTKQTASLLFAGKTRSNQFSFEDQRLGFYKVRVSYGTSFKEQWVFEATGIWLKVLISALWISVLSIISTIFFFILRRRSHKVKQVFISKHK